MTTTWPVPADQARCGLRRLLAQPVNAASLMRFTAFILIARSARKARAEAGRGGNCALCIIVGWLRLLLAAPLQFYDTHVM
jgi:hypothetical protein